MTQSSVEFALAFSTGLLVVVLLISGCSKIRHSDRTLRAMGALRVPLALQDRFIARALPIIELLLAVVLLVLPGVFRTLAAGITLLLFVVFTVLLARALTFPEEVDCGCFGALSVKSRVTRWSIVRNTLFILASLLIAITATGYENFFMEFGSMPHDTQLLLVIAWLAVAVLVLGAAFWEARKSVGLSAAGSIPNKGAVPISIESIEPRDVPPMSPISIALGIDPSRPGEIEMGSAIPTSELVGSNGMVAPLGQIGNGRPTLLIFLSADCGSCEPVGQLVAAWAGQLAPVQLRVATSSTPQAINAKFPGIDAFTLYGSRSALRDLGVQRSPAAIALGGNQQPVIASPIAYGLVEIEGLVAALSPSPAR